MSEPGSIPVIADSLDLFAIEPEASQSAVMPDTAVLTRHDVQRRYVALMKRQHLREAMIRPPTAAETMHIISNGNYDYWTYVPVLIDWLGGQIDELWCSTWTISREIVTEIFELMDTGRAENVTILTGLTLKNRKPAIAALLTAGLARRGGRYLATRNHAKIALLRAGDRTLAMEGSANFTNNPRVEQCMITGDPELFNFHREWMADLCRKRGV
jgi:hypothetical protein